MNLEIALAEVEIPTALVALEEDGLISMVLKLTQTEGVGGCFCLLLPENQKQKVKVLSNFTEVLPGDHLGKEILFEDLPEEVREHVLERMA